MHGWHTPHSTPRNMSLAHSLSPPSPLSLSLSLSLLPSLSLSLYALVLRFLMLFSAYQIVVAVCSLHGLDADGQVRLPLRVVQPLLTRPLPERVDVAPAPRLV